MNKIKVLYLAVVLLYVMMFVYSIVDGLSRPFTGEPYYLQEGE